MSDMGRISADRFEASMVQFLCQGHDQRWWIFGLERITFLQSSAGHVFVEAEITELREHIVTWTKLI